MAVLAKKNEPRCKLCRSAHREYFDHLLELRSDGKADKVGQRVNFVYVQAKYREKHDGQNLSIDNVQSHWKKHCERIVDDAPILDAGKEAESDAEKAAIFDRVLGPGWKEREKTPDEYLQVLREIAFVELHDKAVAGAQMGVSVDHALKAIDSTTRRKQEETTATLVKQLVTGIGQAVIAKASEPKQLNPADEDIIEGEIIEEGQVAERSESD